MVWSQMDQLRTPPIVTSDFIYLRLMGDRRLAEDQFGKIQIDRTEEIRNWSNKMKDVRRNEKDVKAAIVAANNHYGAMDVELFLPTEFGYGKIILRKCRRC